MRRSRCSLTREWVQCGPRSPSAALHQTRRAGNTTPPSSIMWKIRTLVASFWHLGLVALALPNARIIHCRRDIRDCGLSIFAHNFNLQQTWSTSLEDIAHYWRGYRHLMAHWKAVTQLNILTVDYEDTVSDLETQARRITDFLDLGWEAQLLQFHENERAVQTPSRWQVRQPVYRSAMAKWRHYESHLGPLTAAFEAQS